MLKEVAAALFAESGCCVSPHPVFVALAPVAAVVVVERALGVLPAGVYDVAADGHVDLLAGAPVSGESVQAAADEGVGGGVVLDALGVPVAVVQDVTACVCSKERKFGSIARHRSCQT